jgi:hypothetical protein
VGYLLYGVIGAASVLGELRHPSMHPMQPLRHGLGVCPVRTELAKDDPPAEMPDELYHLTEPVVGYAKALSARTPVIYASAEFHGGDGEQGACGWAEGRLAFGPVVTIFDITTRTRWRRRPQYGAINEALAWLGVPKPRRGDRFAAVGLGERHDWEHERMEGGAAR